MEPNMAKKRMCIVGNGNFGLYYGEVRSTDAEVAKTASVRLFGCRHIAYWTGGKGGITALAALGPKDGSRIGPAIESSLLCDVKAIHVVSSNAQRAFDAVNMP
jgi:hypothetical protein